MCGIAGIHLESRQTVPDAAPLEKMIRALVHRGPDGSGMHREPGLGFGHTRLSIIDPVRGAQPLANEDGSIWVTYNGEVFNYIELRSWLEARGHCFATRCDTEVLVHLYEELGEAFVERLNGQFAFALWDRRQRRLMLVRDRAGILPLYYAELPGRLLFASEVKALLATGLLEAAADPEALDELMTFWAPLAPRTMFRGVKQVCPGEMLVAENGSVRRRSYWDWTFPPSGEHRRAPQDELVEELNAHLGDATRIRLRADVPVGAYLSGGLDSSSLVALLSERVTPGLRTFSIGFEDAGLDESAEQRLVAERFGTHHEQIRCTPADVAASFVETIRHAESPVLRSAPAPMRLLSGLVRRSNIKVVLTGEGADEVLGGYDLFKEAKVRQFWARQVHSAWRPGLLRRLYPYLDMGRPESAANLREFFGMGLDDPDDACFSHLPRWTTTSQCKLFLSGAMRAGIHENAIDRLREALPAQMRRWHPFNRAEYLEAKTLLPGYLLSSQGDRMLMANSIEGRFPYLDHRLIGFATQLHPSHKMRALREKHLLREVMKARLPPNIVVRHKQPYRAPDAAAFLHAPIPEYVERLLSRACLSRYGYFDPDKVARLVSKLRSTLQRGRGAVSQRDNMSFMGVLSTQIWHALFVERIAFDAESRSTLDYLQV